MRKRTGRERIFAALLICALTMMFHLLLHCAWMLAPRAAQAGDRIWRVIYIALRRPGGRRRNLLVNIRIRLMPREDRIAAWGAAKRLFPGFGKRRGVYGVGNGAAAPPDSATAQRKPPLRTGAILYSEYGPNYAPAFPEGAVVGSAHGYGNKFPIRSISQILSCDRAGAPDRCKRERCASAREALVAKYGCGPDSESGLHVWRRLIVEELGGGPSDWNAICWSGRDSDGAEAAGSGWR